MEGIAVHDETRAEFIPVYLTTYNKAVSLFPPFLKATSSYGYHLPHKINDLIGNLQKMTGVRKPKEQTIKDELFICDMKEAAKHFLLKKHLDCNAEYCHLVCSYYQLTDV